jgi:hypothetical protein
MATVNKRVGSPQAFVINGVDAGGAMSANIQCGNENVLRSSPDGLQVPVLDKECQFVRGTIVSQDWIHIIDLLTGTVGTYVFYERKSGVAEATGFIKHTLTAPIIHRAALAFNQGGYATITFDFECRAASETATIADMWALTDTVAAPTYVVAARGGWRIVSAVYGAALSIYHVTGFNFSITLPLVKACNDADIAYTCVDARLDGIQATGSINFQDATIATATLTCQQLLLAAIGNLVITVKQSQAAANKIITIARASILNAGGNSDASAPFTGYNAAFEVANLVGTPLTLAGTNKIITIADAA